MKNKVFWFTGLSGSGKTTIAKALKPRLHNCVHLDGDVVRTGLNSDLGFSVEDRNENIRRISEVMKLFYLNGFNVLVTFISPIQSQRIFARNLIPAGDFIEIHLNTSLEDCEKRDVKGLYAKARAGIIPDFTGIDSPYEEPFNPEVTIDTAKLKLETCVAAIMHTAKVVDAQTPHMSFIGRWCPLHQGHTWIIEKKVNEFPGCPILVYVRNTAFDEIPADKRAKLVRMWMEAKNIQGHVQIIPDIDGVYYGRGVGYNVEEIQPPDNIKAISATEIRRRIKEGDESWKELVAEGTQAYVKELFKEEN